MRREREIARKLMEEQKLSFSKRLESGEKLTDAEKAQMLNAESALANKERNLEEEMSKRRDISEKIIQEQMKRKRQTKKIEERLAKLIPLINEANSMAEELKKPVRFEARLSVKSNNVNLSTLDELRNLKTIDVTIRVTSLDNGNVWHWNHVKFDSRLYMMREVRRKQNSRAGMRALSCLLTACPLTVGGFFSFFSSTKSIWTSDLVKSRNRRTHFGTPLKR